MTYTALPRPMLDASRARASAETWLPLAAAFLFGFVLQFNPLSSTWGLPFTRLSDAFVFILLAVLVPRLRVSEAAPLGVAVLCFALLTAASLVFKTASQQGDSYMTLMIFASLVLALCMVALDRDLTALQTWFSVGLLVGMVPSVVVLVLRVSGLDLTTIGLGTPQRAGLIWNLALAKPGGLWVHGNEAGHVYALAGAAALYLSLRYNRPTIYLLYYLLFLATFVITLNRGGTIAPTAGLVVAFLFAGRAKFLTRLALALLGSIGLAQAVSHLPAFQGLRDVMDRRFASDGNADHNIAERVETLLGGIRVALRHPFGIGYADRVREVAYESLVVSGSSHNGLLALAYQAGVAMTGLYIAASVFVLSRVRNFRTLPFLITAFALVSLSFEELTLNPDFQFAIGLTIATFAVSLLRSPIKAPRPSAGQAARVTTPVSM